MERADSNREFYFKGIYPVAVLSGVQDGLVEVRAKATFLHTSAYLDGKRQVWVGVTQKRWVRGRGFEGSVSPRLVTLPSDIKGACLIIRGVGFEPLLALRCHSQVLIFFVQMTKKRNTMEQKSSRQILYYYLILNIQLFV